MPLSRHSVGTYQETRSHAKLVGEHSTTVVSARWATVDRSWRKEWNLCARADLHQDTRKRGKATSVEENHNVTACAKNRDDQNGQLNTDDYIDPLFFFFF